MIKKIFNKPVNQEVKGKSKVKKISYVIIIVSVLSIADQFLDWGIIDNLLNLLGGR